MVHKFARKGDLAQALNKKTRQFYESRIYQSCSWISIPLPYALSRQLTYVKEEMLDYRDQILNIIELQQGIIESRPAGMNLFCGILFAQVVCVTQLGDPLFAREVGKMAPRFVDWYQWIAGKKLAISRGVQERIDDYKRSRSIFDRTPMEVTRIHKASILKKRRLLNHSSGTVQIHFYASLEKGKYGFVNHPPDFITSLYFDETKGICLGELRHGLGLESVAIITDNAPFRTVFEPANEDWLSPLAVCDLTEKFQKPLRVFENRVSQGTKAKRVIREPAYLAIVFMTTLFQLLIGCPEKDIEYMRALYGSHYANAYHAVGQFTSDLNAAAVRAIQAVLQAVLRCVLILCMALYAVLFSVFGVTQAIVLPTARAVRSLGPKAYAEIISFAAELDTKGWLILGAVMWFVFAEINSLLH